MLGDSNVANAPKPKKGKTIEETYQKKTQLEHILLRPDTYIGSVEKVRGCGGACDLWLTVSAFALTPSDFFFSSSGQGDHDHL